MEALLETVRSFLAQVNWQSPSSFVIIAIGLLGLTGRWGSVLMVLVTVVLAAIAQNLIVLNVQTAEVVAPVSLVIYCIGSVLVGGIFLVSFVRFMLS